MNKYFSYKRKRIWASPELLHKAKMEPILEYLIILPRSVKGVAALPNALRVCAIVFEATAVDRISTKAFVVRVSI